MRAHAYNPGPWEVEAGGSGDQGHPWIYSKPETSLGYIRRKEWGSAWLCLVQELCSLPFLPVHHGVSPPGDWDRSYSHFPAPSRAVGPGVVDWSHIASLHPYSSFTLRTSPPTNCGGAPHTAHPRLWDSSTPLPTWPSEFRAGFPAFCPCVYDPSHKSLINHSELKVTKKNMPERGRPLVFVL